MVNFNLKGGGRRQYFWNCSRILHSPTTLLGAFLSQGDRIDVTKSDGEKVQKLLPSAFDDLSQGQAVPERSNRSLS